MLNHSFFQHISTSMQGKKIWVVTSCMITWETDIILYCTTNYFGTKYPM